MNTTPSLLGCPSCGSVMFSLRFARRVHGDVSIDVCWSCHALWFDQYESAQLTPTAVLTLFRRIHEHRDQLPHALGDHLHCPRCPAPLVRTLDMQRDTRIAYLRCPDDHGRLTTFVQFLREKGFVRSLSVPEIASLKATVSQVRCSSCGAVIDLARDSACGYCRAPLAVLDSDAVEKALAALHADDVQRTHPDADRIAARFEAMLREQRAHRHPAWWASDVSSSMGGRRVVDLLVAGIAQLFH